MRRGSPRVCIACPQAVPFAHGSLIPLRGVEHRIAHVDSMRGGIRALPGEAGEAPVLRVACHGEHLARRIRDHLKSEAKHDLEAAVRVHTQHLGLCVRRVTVRDTTSRWGSCSAAGALNFSWRLIFAPSEVLDYLAAHEVAHLVHMNHSDAFWRLTRQLAPQTDRAEVWLRAHGASLHRFGVDADQDETREKVR